MTSALNLSAIVAGSPRDVVDREHAPGLDEDAALDRIIEAFKAFHDVYGLLSEGFEVL